MGHFFATTAFRTAGEGSVRDAVFDYLKSHDVHAEPAESGSLDEATDIIIHNQKNGWVVVDWPQYFGLHDFPFAEIASDQMRIDISTIHIYDGDFWEHYYVSSGKPIFFFCSQPDYFGLENSPYRVGYPADVEQLCRHLKIDKSDVDRYLVDSALAEQETGSQEEARPEGGNIFLFLIRLLAYHVRRFENSKNSPAQTASAPEKAYPSDEFAVDNIWVFVDFWAKLGIRYSEAEENIYSVMRIEREFGKKLPIQDH